MPAPMNVDRLVERQAIHGQVTVEKLVKALRVSAVTVRGDLDALSQAGSLVRSHGGAVLPLNPVQDYPVEVKETLHHAEKKRIGQAAAQRAPLQIADVQKESPGEVLDVVVRAGFRALLFIPLLGAEQVVGALVVRRKRPGDHDRPRPASRRGRHAHDGQPRAELCQV